MSERGEHEQILQQKADEAWKKDDYTSEVTTITDGTGEEIFCADDLVVEQKNDASLKKGKGVSQGFSDN